MERVLDLESKLEKQQETMEKLREEATEAKLQEAVKTTEYRVREEMTPKQIVSDDQLSTLQARLESLHAAQLLTDDELYALEDVCADYMALGTVTAELALAHRAATKLVQLVRVSEGIAVDAAFARQARRKFV